MKRLKKRADEVMQLQLYHASLLGNIESILQNGLVPGFQSPSGQDWQGEYSGQGIYFHSSFPNHELDQTEMFDMNDDLDGIPVVFEVIFTANEDEIEDKLVPEEETSFDGSGLECYLNGEAVVWLDNIKSSNIVAVYYYDDERVRNFIVKNYKIDFSLLKPSK